MTRTRTLSRGILAAVAVLAVGIFAVSGPLGAIASPPMVYPVARLFSLKVTEAARGANLAALEMNGYEVLPPVVIER